MKVYYETTLEEFKAWSGAHPTVKKIIDNNKQEDFEQLVEELFPDGLSETQLNDYLWFNDEQIFADLGIYDEEDED